MPIIKKQQIEKFVLPSFEEVEKSEQAWVELEFPAKMIDFENADDTLSPIRQSASIIVKKIKDWNFCDDEGKKLEINIDNLLLLDPTDVAFLSQKVGLDKISKLSTGKKNS